MDDQHPGGLSEQDLWHRDIMRDMLLKSNAVVMDYAKQMIAVAFAAIGVVTALADLGGYTLVVLAAALCLGYLIAAGFFLRVLFPRSSSVTPNDYADAPARIQALATARRRTARVGTWVTVVVTLGTIVFFSVSPTAG